jgi:DNA-binding NtrC family response regulator/pSer/pThr/pTyr-binding forkhead associated (FHA) protein
LQTEDYVRFALIMLNGPTPGVTRRLDPQATVTVGRHPSRDLPLDDDRASRLHARISFRADRWHIEDCGSLNGTMVNSQPVQQAVLEPGDLIRIGERLLLFAAEESDSGQTEPGSVRATTWVRRDELGGLHVQESSNGRKGVNLTEESVSESMSRVTRDSAVLCKLATHLHEQTEIPQLLRHAVEALMDGLNADAVAIWLVGTDGRLRCAQQEGNEIHVRDDHVMASLAVEKRKAILMDSPPGRKESAPDGSVSIGRAMGVPIPARKVCLGGIECYRDPSQAPFARSDLDFAVVVAHQTGAALENLEHRERLEQANVELRRRLDEQNQLIGSSQAMQDVLDCVARVGPTASNVLILGESGTGKELIARAIHDLSRHSAGPYVTVNCAAFSESLLESELFGHEPGAFTGADRRHIGQIERAHRGTLFLDEVGEMSLACQAKLLRVLEGHPFQRLGGEELIRVDVRLIAATHRDLQQRVRDSRFREDLYYRLRVIDIPVPPLRGRGNDVVLLASQFLEWFHKQMGRGPKRLSAAAAQAIRDYHWPGNVRELKNAVERAVVLGRGDEVAPEDLGMPQHSAPASAQPQLTSLREAERRHIEFVLQEVGGNKTQACRILGIGRGTLYNKLAGIEDNSALETVDEEV